MAALATNHGLSGHDTTLWTGPARLVTIRTSKTLPMESLLKRDYQEPTGIRKQHRSGPVKLGKLGFDEDEHAFAVHGGPEKAVLQYNPAHYDQWKDFLHEIKVEDAPSRNALLELGGFGENIATVCEQSELAMDEHTVCIGDLIGFQHGNNDTNASDMPKMRVTGPRLPCFKLNHRFGLPKMSQYTQNKFWTGWLYSIDTTGEVEAGDKMILLERPFPQWPVARIQHYLFKETTNATAIKEAVDTLGSMLVYDVKDIFKRRLTKGTEDMNLRLQGDSYQGEFTPYRLLKKIKQNERVSEFVFERLEKLDAQSSSDFQNAEPGSHIRLRLNIDGQKFVRLYSVIAGNSNRFSLGIALADQSRGGSKFLHQELDIDNVIEVATEFANTFALEGEKAKRHVFLAGGIGITAFLGHIEYCVRRKIPFHLHYMIRDKSDRAFHDSIVRMLDISPCTNDDRLILQTNSRIDDHQNHGFKSAKEHPHVGQVNYWISSEGQRCDTKEVLRVAEEEPQTHIYVCGSERLSEAVSEAAKELRITNDRLHFEQFAADATGDPFTVQLAKAKKKIEVPSTKSLLEALREAGMDVPSSCEVGNCATCRVTVKCGKVVHRGVGLEDDEKAGASGREEGDMLSCVSRGVGRICLDL